MADTKPTPEDEGPADGQTEELVAFLDGELNAKETESVATRISLDPNLRAEAESLQRAWDILDILPRPQPSPTFTTRTLTLAIPGAGNGGSGAIPNQSSPTIPIVTQSASSVGFWVISFIVLIASAGMGYFAHRELVPPPKQVSLSPDLEDHSLVKNLRLYRYVDDIDYLKRLDSAELFADDFDVAPTTGSGALNPDDPSYIRRQFVWFQAQDDRRRQQLRKLHADFQQLDPETATELTRVMQNYNAWLTRPNVDRSAVLNAPSAAARLEVIRNLREAEWIETLPRPDREEYARLEGEARRQRVQEWRMEEADRREEWNLAQKHWAEHPLGKTPAVFQNQKNAIELFVSHLRENMLPDEIKYLEDARLAAEEFGNYFGYALEVVRMADRHPILPGAVGARDWATLPASVKDYLMANDKRFKDKGIIASPEIKELRKAQGRWPAFALELTKYCQKNNLTLPEQLGDCRKEKMPPEVIEFLDKTLERELRRTDAGKAELEALNKAQGTWPDYPRKIMELSRNYKLPVPGWTLPGPLREWDRFRAGKPRGKV